MAQATPNKIMANGHELGARVKTYPVYPSAQITVNDVDYMDAVRLLGDAGTECVFCDGETILVPEYEAGVIDLLIRRFGASVEYGHASDSEYCTLAIRAGVSAQLVEIGHAVQNCSGMTPQQMLEFALASPELAQVTWRNVHLASMSPQ